jgi:hypothetical protein
MLDAMVIALGLLAFAGCEALCRGLARLPGGAR